MIDAHIHVVPPRLPGVGPLHPRLTESPAAVADWLRGEMRDAGVTHGQAMGSWAGGDDDPLGVAASLEIAERVPGLLVAGVADPGRPDPEHRQAVERVLATGRVRALKVYLGYLHYEPAHANYRPYYELAERFHLPVIFHCGDTYSPFAKLRFAHPLGVDEVAVDHPKVRCVLAHMGNPWLTDAAEVVYKNVNVWADLSAFIVGDGWDVRDADTAERLEEIRSDVLKAIRFCERPNRLLYGSDWPLVPLKWYRELIAGWMPGHLHDLVFDANARALFRV
jgi:hypothetical protein